MVTSAEIDAIVRQALAEDLGPAGDDVTSRCSVSADQTASGRFVFREAGVLCGTAWLESVFRQSDADLQLNFLAHDGDWIEPGVCVATVAGRVRGILAGERTALNMLSRLTGVATITRMFVQAVAGTRARIYDTRKTTPLLRALEKYAVTCGGGVNHRMGLYDQILIKDNHIAASGLRPAELARRVRPQFSGTLIVEVDRPEDAAPAAEAGADVVLLDNMTPAEVRAAVRAIEALAAGRRPRAAVEASGGVTLANVRAYAEAGADRISIGALTHSARAIDIALDLGAG
jgi:nicotinate-nucleotide pyrophosphorylase (carboxylating)